MAQPIRFIARPAAIGLLAMGLFAPVLIAVGAFVLVRIDSVVAAQPETSRTALLVTGVVAIAAGLWFLVPLLRRRGRVASIEITADNAWRLKSMFGRTLGELANRDARTLILEGRRTVVMTAVVPRVIPLVFGRLETDGKTYRLMPSGPVTYRQALAALGRSEKPPGPGETVTIG